MGNIGEAASTVIAREPPIAGSLSKFNLNISPNVFPDLFLVLTSSLQGLSCFVCNGAHDSLLCFTSLPPAIFIPAFINNLAMFSAPWPALLSSCFNCLLSSLLFLESMLMTLLTIFLLAWSPGLCKPASIEEVWSETTASQRAQLASVLRQKPKMESSVHGRSAVPHSKASSGAISCDSADTDPS